MEHDRRPRGLSRRGFLQAGAALGAGAAAAGAAGPAWADGRGDPLRVGRLRAGAVRDPIGIQSPRPQLSWQLTGAGLQRRQTAYQLRVASSAARLRGGRADLWDTGRVTSSASSQIAYGGRPLSSRTQAFWQVRVWDEGHRASAWSPVSVFEIGLLAPTDWTAAWIGNPGWDALGTPTPPATITVAAQPARFVRLSVTKLGLPLKEGWPDPVSRLQLAEIQVVNSANPDVDLALHKAVTCTDVYSAPGAWEPEYLTDGKTSGDTPPIGFTSLEHHGQDVSAAPILVTIDLGSVQTFDRVVVYPRTDVQTPDGRTPNFPVDFTVQTAVAATGPFAVAATVSGQAPPEPAPTPTALPVFAKQFDLTKNVAHARLYITGLGVYSATINGRPTSNAVLEPGNTTYERHLDYATVDVTDLLRRGANAIGVSVGTGIYDTLTYSSRYAKFNARIGPPKLLAQLEITYSDGSRHTVATDPTWRTTDGPTTFANWYGGEDYDARRLPIGWDAPGADLSGWQPAIASSAPAATTVLTARSGPAVEGVERVTTKQVTQPKPGIYVFDLGTNIAGWQHLTVRGPAGTKITMRPAELLHADGTIDYASTGSPIYDVYTLRGGGTETWHPEFLYHGFRYLQVEGLPSAPTNDTISATVLRAANESAGTFSCSNELINSIHRIIDRATQGNMFSVLTDCPTREKLGWMEEDHLVFDTVTRNYDIAAYGHDVVQAMADAQLDNGLVPDIAPEYTVFGGGFRDDPNWGNAVVLVPWSLYRAYGDRDLLNTFYPNMQRYVDYLGTKATGHLLDYGLGDWATINATTPTGVTATYGYLRAVDGLRQIAGVLGRSADEATYTQLVADIRAAFHAKYFDAAHHTYATGSQCSDALALDMGAVPDSERAAVLDHLVANLQGNGYHLNLGEIGLPSLFDVLFAAGRSEVIYQIATQTTEPSYGAMLARGATSLTEFWDGSGSQNHFMLGAIDKWFTSGLAGIAQADDSAGFERLVIAPAIVGDLTQVSGRYETPNGSVRTEWVRSGRSVRLDVTVPVGSTATVRLPGQPDRQVGSGTYEFRATMPPTPTTTDTAA
jgi:alpha-L-rhamnosidase